MSGRRRGGGGGEGEGMAREGWRGEEVYRGGIQGRGYEGEKYRRNKDSDRGYLEVVVELWDLVFVG
jgi:hypothetical protein